MVHWRSAYCMPREHICFSLSKHARIDFILYTCTIVALPRRRPNNNTHTVLYFLTELKALRCFL
jgi:hypothetical protein